MRAVHAPRAGRRGSGRGDPAEAARALRDGTCPPGPVAATAETGSDADGLAAASCRPMDGTGVFAAGLAALSKEHAHV
ncbi:hypothetical protein [Roseicyclus sp.]